MAVQFRCRACGVTIQAEVAPTAPVSCPQCGASVEPPAPTTSPPRPLRVDTGDDVTLSPLIGVLPWAISAVFHIIVVLLMLFVVLTYRPVGNLDRIIIPDARLTRNPGGKIVEAPVNQTARTDEGLKQSRMHAYTKAASMDLLSEVTRGKSADLRIVGIGGGGAGSQFGLKIGGGAGPKSSFLGSGGNAYKIVYVCDASGSMIDTFDYVRAELKKSITALQSTQSFHVVFFPLYTPKPDKLPQRNQPDQSGKQPLRNKPGRAGKQLLQNKPGKLVHATPHNKQEAIRFLDTLDLVVGQHSDPVPALRAAFNVPGGPPDLIYFMTDGQFDRSVVNRIRQWNKSGRVKVNTIAFLWRDPASERLLKQIAKESGGRYKFVSADELGE